MFKFSKREILFFIIAIVVGFVFLYYKYDVSQELENFKKFHK